MKRFDNWGEVILRVKWIMFVSQWCYKSGPLKVIGQSVKPESIGRKTRVLAGFHDKS